MAQVGAVTGNLEGEPLDNPLRDVYIVSGAGLSGAILGLSTLSFVDEPSEHLRRILTGGSLGIIVGVSFVAWQQANKSKTFYEDHASLPQKKMTTFQRVSWHHANHSQFSRLGGMKKPLNIFSFSFPF